MTTTLERLKELYDRDFPHSACECNNEEYRKFVEDLLIIFPQLLAVVEAASRVEKSDIVNQAPFAGYSEALSDLRDALAALNEKTHRPKAVL